MACGARSCLTQSLHEKYTWFCSPSTLLAIYLSLFVLMGFCSLFSPRRMSCMSCWGLSAGLCECSDAVNCYTLCPHSTSLLGNIHRISHSVGVICVFIFLFCLLSNMCVTVNWVYVNKESRNKGLMPNHAIYFRTTNASLRHTPSFSLLCLFSLSP